MRARAVYATIVVFVTLVGLVLVGVQYVDHVDHRSEQRNIDRAREICGLISVLDDAYRDTPPTTPLGRNVASEVHAYRLKLGC